MMQPGLDVQKAMMQKLAARRSLVALLGGAHVYDELPRGARTPHVVFALIETRDWSVADQKAHESFISIEINSASRSRQQTQQVVQEIETALDGANLALVDNILVNLRCIFISAARPKNNQFFSATMRFRAATEPRQGQQI